VDPAVTPLTSGYDGSSPTRGLNPLTDRV